MAEFTLLEIHLDGATFTANAPFGGDSESESESESESDSPSTLELGSTGGDDGDGDDAEGRPVAPLLVGLVGLVVLGVLLKRLLGGAGNEVGDDEPV